MSSFKLSSLVRSLMLALPLVLVTVPAARADKLGVEKRRVLCESKNLKHAKCSVPGYVLDVSLETQLSKAPCIEGTTYWKKTNAVVVKYGCRGEFILRYVTYN